MYLYMSQVVQTRSVHTPPEQLAVLCYSARKEKPCNPARRLADKKTNRYKGLVHAKNGITQASSLIDHFNHLVPISRRVFLIAAVLANYIHCTFVYLSLIPSQTQGLSSIRHRPGIRPRIQKWRSIFQGTISRDYNTPSQLSHREGSHGA